MEKKDLQKQQRRKRKDPESRDFKCKCGKSYLSYAAVYTHVKNKHNGEKEFEDSIVKPEKQKLKRGRPRDKKKIVISSETQILSICEETTLLIYEQLKELKDRFSHHIILEGNEEMSQEAFNKEYRRLNDQSEANVDLLHGSEEKSDEDDHRIFCDFLKGVIKHFSAEIAAKVSYVVNRLAKLYGEVNFQDINEIEPHLRELDGMAIWEGKNQINSIIYQAMIKWIDISRKEENDSEEN